MGNAVWVSPFFFGQRRESLILALAVTAPARIPPLLGSYMLSQRTRPGCTPIIPIHVACLFPFSGSPYGSPLLFALRIFDLLIPQM